jgi:hypothetical protein
MIASMAIGLHSVALMVLMSQAAAADCPRRSGSALICP